MRPETPDQPRSPEDENGGASTPNEARTWRSTALAVDHALRSAVDRVRPAAHRVREWLAPLLERIVRWLAPLLQRVQDNRQVRRIRERVAPHVEAVRERLPESGRAATRTRSMQVGGAIAAVGVLGVVVAGVATGGGASQQAEVTDAAQAAPMAGAPAPVTPERAQPAPEAAPAPQPSGDQGNVPPPPPPPPAPEPEAPEGPPVDGIDVSNHNGDIDWQQVAASGKKFTFVLATDGTSFSNPRYSEQYHGAKDAGLIAGAYHFARPDSSSAEVQAQRFLDVADYQNDHKTLPPVLDLEVDPNSGGCYGLSVDDMNLWVKTFNDKVKERTGKEPIIYANPSFWRQCMGGTDSFGHHNLWLASYGVDSPSVPNGFDGWDFWQYSEEGQVPGIGGSTDLNKYQHGIAKLQQLAR
ncbi:GH25 family lysozyme [Saccharopolyspora rosea]|uniref:GH25 family lysozyme n=1 Tax=Saccharopolyspora rosea TaxID=524884 RepID=A0ABW3FZI8_9PSEU|nr:GH25 family lysozyme [Saccharopolyspora rosea]